MNRATTLGFVLLVCCIICNSCKKDTHTDCPKPIYYYFSHLDSTRSPYKGKDTLRFLYRDGQKTDTFIFKPKKFVNDTPGQGEVPLINGCLQSVFGQHHQFTFYNTKKLDPQYDLVIEYTANAGGADFKIKYDSIFVNSGLFGLDNPALGHYHSSMTIEGTTFYVVNDFEQNSYPGFYTIYYTSHDGIIRMEYKNGTSLTLIP